MIPTLRYLKFLKKNSDGSTPETPLQNLAGTWDGIGFSPFSEFSLTERSDSFCTYSFTAWLSRYDGRLLAEETSVVPMISCGEEVVWTLVVWTFPTFSSVAAGGSSCTRVLSNTSPWLSRASEEGLTVELAWISAWDSDSVTPSGQQWLSDIITWSSLSVMVIKSWLHWWHLSGTGFRSWEGRLWTSAKLWKAPQATWSTTRPARCSTFCGFVTGKVVVMRPNWQPVPHAQISLLRDNARVCSSPHANCKILTANKGLLSESEMLTGFGSGTYGWLATAHWPEEFSPHMYTTPLSVTAPVWKLPVATVTTYCPTRAFSRMGLLGQVSAGSLLQGRVPKL